MSISVALLILFGGLIVYGLLLFFTGYIRVAAPLGAVAVNGLWYYLSEYKGFDLIKYPVFLEKKLLSCLIISVVVFIIADIISIPRKLRTTSLLSFGTLFVMFGLITVIWSTEGFTPAARLAYVVFGTVVSLGLEIAAVIKRNYDVATGIAYKIVASIFLVPLPFMTVCTLCIYLSGGTRLTVMNMIAAIAVSVVTMGIYVGVASAADTIRRRRAADDRVRTEERNRVRSKIASLMDVQVAKIDEYVSYLQDMSAYIPKAQVSRIYAISREATQIRNYYSGTANGEALKRITEIKDELFTIKNVVQNLYRSNATRPGAAAQDNGPRYDFRSKPGHSGAHKAGFNDAGRGGFSAGAGNSSGAGYSGAANSGNMGSGGTKNNDGSAYDGDTRSTRDANYAGNTNNSGSSNYAGNANAGAGADNTGHNIHVDQELSEQSVIAAFFNGCETESDVKKRYHQLCKVFHPDSDSGDADTFMQIKEEYERLIEVKRSRT